MKNYIKGNLKKIIFSSSKGYYIGLFKINETNDPELDDFINKSITFTGYFPELKIDESYIFYGEIMDHPKYGLQYQVKEFEKIKPQDKDGIIEFLSSDLFKGIGKKMAEKIVDTLGKNTLDRILKEENCLLLVPGLTKKKANNILETLENYEESHQTIVYLTELGFIMKDALAIYNIYKSNTINKIEQNIYDIIDDVDDINFRKIDLIASNLNIEVIDERRIKAGIIFVCEELLFKNKDTYLFFEEIKNSVEQYLNIYFTETDFNNYLNELIDEEKIYQEENNFYLKNYYEAEIEVTNKIERLLKLPKYKIKNFEKNIDNLEKINSIIYNKEQKEAIKSSLLNNITIITGGPGVGKTTIIKAICDIYINLYGDKSIFDIALLAPTGRASKRMSEATLLTASTIHRFLKWNKDNNQFAVNEYNKDFSKLIIVDEVSMIDLELMSNLFKGLTNDIRLVLVGDYNQLPSVGPGQVLRDLIESEIIPTINLNNIYRQSEKSYITELAREIRTNTLGDFLIPKDDYLFLECSSSSIVSNIKKLCQQMIDKNYNYKRIQIMAPMYAGINGIDNLNKELQEIFNKKNKEKQEIIVGNTIYREQDKILQLVNMPDLNVFNGDIGVIKQIIKANESDSKKNEIYVDFDNNLVKYLPNDFIKIKHGYVISTHKSQGSEFELVLLPITKNYNRMLYQKLIYTAITRAKKKLIILGEKDAFLYAIKNNNEETRKTTLKERLKNNV